MKNILIITGLLLSSILFSQTTYYVSVDSTTSTLAQVSSLTLNPGDSVLFHRGETWRGTETNMMAVNYSGTRADRIFYGAYGTGEKPQFFGSIELTSWTNVSGNIWTADQSVPTNPITIDYGAQIFFNPVGDSISEWGYQQSYVSGNANLTTEFEWSWNANTIYIYSPTDPNTRYTNAEAPQAQNCIYLVGNAWITLDNLDIRYLVSMGVREGYGTVGVDGLTVTNCAISNIGTKGGSKAFGLSVTNSNAYYANNVIHDCGRRSISINLYATYPTGYMHNIIIENNYFYNGYHTTGVDCINSGDHLIDSVVIRNNLSQGDTNIILGAEPNDNSNSFYISNQTDATSGVGVMSNIYIYNNIVTYSHGKSIALGNIDTAYIYNNTLFGHNTTIANGQSSISVGERGNRMVYIANNILYNNIYSSWNNGITAFFVSNPDFSTIETDYNLFWSEDPVQHIVEKFQSGSYDREYYMSQWASYISVESPWDANSPIPSDPLFIDAPNDFSLEPESAAIDAGTPISWLTTDYYGNPRDQSTPTIGAIEYGGIDSTATNIISFTLPEQTGSATIDTNNHTIAIEVAYGTSLISLTPTIAMDYGATINPLSGTAQNFSSAFNYTVTALDEVTTQVWTITVTVAAASTETDILTFTIPQQNSSVVNATAHTVSVTMGQGTNVTALIPAITLSSGATINPLSGVAQNFTSPVSYTVTAEDGVTTQIWTVTVIVNPNPRLYFLNGKPVKHYGRWVVE